MSTSLVVARAREWTCMSTKSALIAISTFPNNPPHVARAARYT